MAYSGSCPDMCPEKERQARFGLYMSIFERDHDNQPDEYAMIKEYRRSGADQDEPLPEDLRTPRALELTIDHLVCNVMDDSRSTTQELSMDWYDFLWDRLRAVRKDITQQNICDQAAAILVERCARFHVHSCYAMNRVNNFDVDMNKRNLNDCLQMLRQMYTDLKQTQGIRCPGEWEFQKFDIILHLDQDYLSSNVLMKTSDHRKSTDMKFVTKIFNAYTNNNYYKFFQLMEQADYMTSCLLSLYANKMRLIGMKTIAIASTSRQSSLYPSDLIVNTLGFDGLDDLSVFASALEIETQEKESKSYLILTKQLIERLRSPDTTLSPFKSIRMVESKRSGYSIGQLVYGQPELPENPYRKFPHRTVQPSAEFNLDQNDSYEEFIPSEEPQEMDSVDDTHLTESESYLSSYCPPPVVISNNKPEMVMNVTPDTTEKHEVVEETIKETMCLDRRIEPIPIQEEFKMTTNEEENRPREIDVIHRGVKRQRQEDSDAEMSHEVVPEVPRVRKRLEVKPINVVEDMSPIVDEHTQIIMTEQEEGEEEENTNDLTLIEIDAWKIIPKSRQEIADMMPVGKFKERTYQSNINRNNRTPPQLSNGSSTRKPINSSGKRDILESLGSSIRDEGNVNKLLLQLASMTKSSV